MLYSLGGVGGMQVVDLFAGSGAMGIEALSRGAASVTFVERDPGALETVRKNLAAVGLRDAERAGDATLIRADADAWVATTASRYDLALCDPPYAYGGWDALVERLPADLGILESDGPVPAGPGWRVVKFKRYGGTIVTVLRRHPATRDDVQPLAGTELVTERGVS